MDFVTSSRIDTSFFDRPVEIVAKDILGNYLYLNDVGGMFTETEAYHPRDTASHSFHGLNDKNAAMFGKPGTVYVYVYRGMWHHLNIVCGEPGSAILLRSLRPSADCIDQIVRNRRRWCKGNLGPAIRLCSGPGKLGSALATDREVHNFGSIDGPPFALFRGLDKLPIVRTTRINVPKNPNAELRWYIKECSSVSLTANSPILDGFGTQLEACCWHGLRKARYSTASICDMVDPQHDNLPFGKRLGKRFPSRFVALVIAKTCGDRGAVGNIRIEVARRPVGPMKPPIFPARCGHSLNSQLAADGID
jgi:DNA-3-methyladenine glycosylase